MLDKKGKEVFETVGTSEYIEQSYLIFGKHVNSNRALPEVMDGLKPVYRHVMQATYELPDQFNKLNAIVGDTMKKYHFTGDASITPPISQLVKVGLLDGQGNHGNYVLRGEDDPPAASRYIEAKLNPVVRSQLNKLLPYVPHETSITGFEEYKYIPTPIPFMLIFGTKGIGLGAATNIPAFTVESLYDAYLHNDHRRLKINYGYELDQSCIDTGLKSLWETGRGALRINIPIEPKYIDGEFGYVISCQPKIFKPVYSKLEEWESYGWLSIDDISDDHPKLFIHRVNRVRSITDEQILEELRRVCTYKRGYFCTIYNGRIAGCVSIYNWIKFTIENYKVLFNMYIKDNINKLRFEYIVWRDFRKVADLILKETPNYSYEEIVDLVNADNLKGKREKFRNEYVPLTLEHVKIIGGKSINTLKTTDPYKKMKSISDKIDEFNNLNIDDEIAKVIDSWKMEY